MNWKCGFFVFFLIAAVHSLNLTSVDQNAKITTLEQELKNMKFAMMAMNSTCKYISHFNSCILYVASTVKIYGHVT
jgi:hypothetical protein